VPPAPKPTRRDGWAFWLLCPSLEHGAATSLPVCSRVISHNRLSSHSLPPASLSGPTRHVICFPSRLRSLPLARSFPPVTRFRPRPPARLTPLSHEATHAHQRQPESVRVPHR